MNDPETRRAHVGDWIKVKGLTPDYDTFDDTFHLVSDNETHRAEHDVAVSSVLGEALTDAKLGDGVVLDTKDGLMKLTILRVGPTRGDIL
jgi:transcription elongation GreA/GreB family factor